MGDTETKKVQTEVARGKMTITLYCLHLEESSFFCFPGHEITKVVKLDKQFI